MIEAEERLKKKIRNSKIHKVVLSVLYSAGVLAIALAMPNMLSMLKHLDTDKKRRLNRKYVVNSAIKRLRDKGLIVWNETDKGVFLRLTNEGKKAVELIERNNFKITKPKKWDGKWRVVIFDIKETRKGTREKLRRTLIQIGFIRLQNSVWVFPYSCAEFITLIKTDFKIGKEILYIIADTIENDRFARKHFNLPLM